MENLVYTELSGSVAFEMLEDNLVVNFR